MKFSSLLPVLLVCLMTSWHSLIQPAGALHDSTWKLVFNNLSNKSLTIKICTVPGCVRKSPARYEDFRPFSVEVLGGSDDWPKTDIVIKDSASGRKLSRELWYGQLAASNPSNIFTALQPSPNVTDIWFSDKTGRNVYLGSFWGITFRGHWRQQGPRAIAY
ncbi:hypothetical protein R1sor_009629 [Riccia sorocarpa]|uniref:Uncharacterized protein n=1 Tax=Riccia sorocarpa TaxID=122646 RepID=A0ABD3HVM2_9MARC